MVLETTVSRKKTCCW